MKIYGNLICQDGISEIARCIESVYPVVDEYLVMDGGSKDGTWEWLKKYKDVYNLTLFQRKYDRQDNQRNALLGKTPKNAWVVNVDQDEQLNYHCRTQVRDFLLKRIDRNLCFGKDRDLTLTVTPECVNLIHDPKTYEVDRIQRFTCKIFWNDRNLHFGAADGYHHTIRYFDGDNYSNTIDPDDSWCIFHYAYLNPDRIRNPKLGGRPYGEDEQWLIKEKKTAPLKRRWL